MKKLFCTLTAVLSLITLTTKVDAQTSIESWYTYWGLGYANPTYTGPLDNVLDQVRDIDGMENISIGIDMLGFYLPLNNQTMLGGIINGWGDSYTYNEQEMQINGYLYSASAMYFLQSNIGDGFFLRGDLGAAKMLITATGAKDTSSDWGWGVLVGGGYAIPLNDETRILININYTTSSIEDETYSTFQIMVGGLF